MQLSRLCFWVAVLAVDRCKMREREEKMRCAPRFDVVVVIMVGNRWLLTFLSPWICVRRIGFSENFKPKAAKRVCITCKVFESGANEIRSGEG